MNMSETMVEYKGRMVSAKDLAAISGIGVDTIRMRIKRGDSSDIDRLLRPVYRKNIRTMLTVRGVSDSISGWSNRTGIDIDTIRQRINKLGWSPEEAVGAVAHQNGLERRITINGETHTLVGWARNLGISVGGFQGRYRRYLKGMLSIDRLLQKGHIPNPTPAHNIIRYKWNGGTYSMPELSRIAGIDKSTFYEWLKRGWSIEKIMTTPKMTTEERNKAVIDSTMKNKLRRELSALGVVV